MMCQGVPNLDSVSWVPRLLGGHLVTRTLVEEWVCLVVLVWRRVLMIMQGVLGEYPSKALESARHRHIYFDQESSDAGLCGGTHAEKWGWLLGA